MSQKLSQEAAKEEITMKFDLDFELPNEEEDAKIEKFWQEVQRQLAIDLHIIAQFRSEGEEGELCREWTKNTCVEFGGLIDPYIRGLCYKANTPMALGRTLAAIYRKYSPEWFKNNTRKFVIIDGVVRCELSYEYEKHIALF